MRVQIDDAIGKAVFATAVRCAPTAVAHPKCLIALRFTSLQVEERLRFYEEGIAPTKNLTAMQVRLLGLSLTPVHRQRRKGSRLGSTIATAHNYPASSACGTLPTSCRRRKMSKRSCRTPSRGALRICSMQTSL